MSTPPPFPTPQQLGDLQGAALEPELKRLRDMVNAALKKGPSNSLGEYWIDKPQKPLA